MRRDRISIHTHKTFLDSATPSVMATPEGGGGWMKFYYICTPTTFKWQMLEKRGVNYKQGEAKPAPAGGGICRGGQQRWLLQLNLVQTVTNNKQKMNIKNDNGIIWFSANAANGGLLWSKTVLAACTWKVGILLFLN